MIGKPLAAFLCLGLLGPLRSAEDLPVITTITWQGTAHSEGDAYNLIAVIGEKEARFVWNGLMEPGFPAMDEKLNPMIRREYFFRDQETVEALRIIADQAEQCEVCSLELVCGGIGTKAMVQSPPGKIQRSFSCFSGPDYKIKSRRFQEIPWDLKDKLIYPNAGEEVPHDSEFSKGLRSLGDHLDVYGKALAALTEAYQAGRDLPRAELEKVLIPISLESYLEIDQSSANEAAAIRRCHPVFESILSASMEPTHRALLFGEGEGEGGLILDIAQCQSGDWVQHPLLKMKVTAPDRPVGILSDEGKAFLLHFIMGIRSDKVRDATEVCELIVSKEGKLEIRQENQAFPGFPGFPELPVLPDTPARLEYLNEKNLWGLLLGLNARPVKRVATVKIEAVTLNPANEDQARIDFWRAGEHHILEMNRTDKGWKPGKLWDWADYQQAVDALR